MEAKNFRTGNLISYKSNIYALTAVNAMVDSVYLNYPVDNWVCVSKIKPISINKNILLKLGFVKHGNSNIYIHDRFVLAYDLDKKEVYHTYNPLVNRINLIRYVHELQNLFFAIAGQELELKDESE